MVGVFFSAVDAAASSSQYDGGLSRQGAGEADGVWREGNRLTAAQSNGKKGKDDHFRQSTRIGNDPELAPRDGRIASPMNGERWIALYWQLLGNVEKWSDAGCVTARPDHWLTDVIQVRRPAEGLWLRRDGNPWTKTAGCISQFLREHTLFS